MTVRGRQDYPLAGSCEYLRNESDNNISPPAQGSFGSIGLTRTHSAYPYHGESAMILAEVLQTSVIVLACR